MHTGTAVPSSGVGRKDGLVFSMARNVAGLNRTGVSGMKHSLSSTCKKTMTVYSQLPVHKSQYISHHVNFCKVMYKFIITYLLLRHLLVQCRQLSFRQTAL